MVKTLIHKLAHVLIHLANDDHPELSCVEEELVVESITLSMVDGLGIDTSGYSILYLASWSQVDAHMQVIEACAELSDRHAKRIEERIEDPDAVGCHTIAVAVNLWLDG